MRYLQEKINVGSDDVDKRLIPSQMGYIIPVDSVRQNDVFSSYPWQTNERNKQVTYICIYFIPCITHMCFALAG